MNRILLLIVTNIAVVVVLSIVWNILDSIFGISQSLSSMGLPAHFGYVALMALVLGFGGAFISLWMSKGMAKRSMGVQIIDEPITHQEKWLIEVVRKQSNAVGIKMPEVGIFHSQEPNAFATGARKDNALVAVSQGLLDHMSADEVEAVLGHEISHIANGDMVTQTLLQGVLNTFVIFFARVVGYFIDSLLSRGEDNEGGLGIGYFVTSIIMELLFFFFSALVVMRFSRFREFHADQGGARLTSPQKMISALKRLQQVQSPHDLPGEMAAFGIAGGVGQGLKKLMMTHPPLEDRIAALEAQLTRYQVA